MSTAFDLLIVGGGINGAGIARDAVGRGLSVCLCEMGDFASATSSASTKLIHGGLRYLEYHEYRLVREALIEREVLWRMAPHIIWPMRFVMPHHRDLRPAWLLRLGLFVYDHLGGRKLLPATRTLDLRADAAGAPLKPGLFTRGFEYSDCWVEDARLVVLNARDAADRGALIRPRTKAVDFVRGADGWTVTLRDTGTGAEEQVRARVLVNAAGPWVADVLTSAQRRNTRSPVRLVQGSHIVVRRLFDHDRAYIFQNTDGRIIFAIPYEGDFTLIGTTDRDFQGDPSAVHASEEEVAYLCQAANVYFSREIAPADVVWSYSGVRPLYDDGASKAQAATRDYVLELNTDGGAGMLSVFGGKITTYRRLAEEALGRLSGLLPVGKAWTAGATLPGGDFPQDNRETLAAALKADYPFLAPAHADRLMRSYGTRARILLGGAKTRADLGRLFGADLTEAEVRYLVEHEWARTAHDILWRRSKLGLRLTPAEAGALDAYLAERVPGGAPRP